MLKIYKYEFPINGQVEIITKPIIKILTVGQQKPKILCLWAIVNTDGPDEVQHLWVSGTGQPLPDSILHQTENFGSYLGTVTDTINLVWHIFHYATSPL